MKKLSFLILALLPFLLQGQVIFQEDFDGVGGPTAGGAGTYSFPADWIRANVDNLTPSAAVSYVNEAWERREDFNFSVTDSCAFSTSWYSPEGAADDWMWTPAIGPLPAVSKLTWNAVTYDAANKDGYEVRIMTVTPTGSTGVIGNMITNSTVIFNTSAENNTWTAREVDLSAYAGQTVYIGFRNNSTDKFLLLIDDVIVSQIVNYDIILHNTDAVSQYTMIPLIEGANVCTPGATIKNNGIQVVNNVTLSVEIRDNLGDVVYSESATQTGTLASGATVHLTTSPFTATAVGSYEIFYRASMDETDEDMANDSILINGFQITDSTYARDNSVVTGGLGIGAGNGGYLGQDFNLNATANLSSIDCYVFRGYIGEPFAAVVWNMTAGIPDSIIATTDTLFYPDDSARYYSMKIQNGGVVLFPGDYAVTFCEFDSTMQLGQTADIFTTGHMWVNWPTIASGTWANIETFGASFARTSVIRMNLVDSCLSFNPAVTPVNATCPTCSDGSATVVATGGMAPYSYLWSNGDTTATSSNLVPDNYTVVVTDTLGCSVTLPVTISFNVGIAENEFSAQVYPNPSHGTFTIRTSDMNGKTATVEITDMAGKVVLNSIISQDGLVVSELAAGVYSLHIMFDKESIIRKIVIE